jgi:cysteine desulfurase
MRAMQVYLDNAATTPIDPEVLSEMMPYLTENFGNPSSIHSYGRKTKSAIEKARKIVARYLNASTAEIFFTSGGTEANNTAIKCAVRDLGITRIISSKLEHHCVLHSVEAMQNNGIKIEYVNVDSQGNIDYLHLENLLSDKTNSTLVSLMHANNEIGTLLDLERVSALCTKHGAFFHSDSVQTIAHYPFDVQKTTIHFLSGSAHKFHGPKGAGFLYINSNINLKPFIDGGSQERNMRAGTENVYGIVGLGKALELSVENMDLHRKHIQEIRAYLYKNLLEGFKEIEFNGNVENGLYTVLSVSFPPHPKADLLLFNLDISGIAASGGSACTSGSEKGSHVLEAICANPNRKAIRFSFSKNNSIAEIDYLLDVLKQFTVETAVADNTG